MYTVLNVHSVPSSSNLRSAKSHVKIAVAVSHTATSPHRWIIIKNKKKYWLRNDRTTMTPSDIPLRLHNVALWRHIKAPRKSHWKHMKGRQEARKNDLTEEVVVCLFVCVSVTVVLPGGAGPVLGSVAGDLQQEAQEHAQHSQAHVGLC